MLRMADSAKMFPFSLAVCQILLLSNPGECHQHAISTGYLPSLTQTQPFASFFFFPLAHLEFHNLLPLTAE